ncbi:MAG: hypothetical protein ACJ8DQ_18510 [Xanthobacteraceae bacterium]
MLGDDKSDVSVGYRLAWRGTRADATMIRAVRIIKTLLGSW